jgi:hypothetical protein
MVQFTVFTRKLMAYPNVLFYWLFKTRNCIIKTIVSTKKELFLTKKWQA